VKLNQPSLNNNVTNDPNLTASLFTPLPKLGSTISSVTPQSSLSPTPVTSNSDSANSSSLLKTSCLKSNDVYDSSDTQPNKDQTDEAPKDTSQTSPILSINGEKLKASRSSSPKRASSYYTKLTKLNQAFYNWIKEFMEESPDYDYSPVCHDYLKHIEKLKKDFPLKSQLKEETSVTELLDKADEKNASDASDMTEESEESSESDEEESNYKQEYLNFVKNINSDLLDKEEEHDEHDESFESEPIDESDSESFESSSKSSLPVHSSHEKESSPVPTSESKVTVESKSEEQKDVEYSG